MCKMQTSNIQSRILNAYNSLNSNSIDTKFDTVVRNNSTSFIVYINFKIIYRKSAILNFYYVLNKFLTKSVKYPKGIRNFLCMIHH